MIYMAIGLSLLLNIYLSGQLSHSNKLAEDWRRHSEKMECEATAWKQAHEKLGHRYQELIEAVDDIEQDASFKFDLR